MMMIMTTTKEKKNRRSARTKVVVVFFLLFSISLPFVFSLTHTIILRIKKYRNTLKRDKKKKLIKLLCLHWNVNYRTDECKYLLSYNLKLIEGGVVAIRNDYI